MKRLLLLLVTTLLALLPLTELLAQTITLEDEQGVIYECDLTTMTACAGGKPYGDIVVPETISYGDNIFTVVSVFFGEPPGFYNYNTYTKSVSIPNTVTSIREWAFLHCSSLEYVVIPDSIISIGDLAFSGCSSLTSISLQSGERVDGEIVLPEGLITMGRGLFDGVTKVNKINIPGTVTKIGGSPFPRIQNIYIENLERWTEWIFNGTVYENRFLNSWEDHAEDGSMITIKKHVYYNGEPITSFTIPEGTTEIRPGLFAYCTDINTLVIPETIKKIGREAFRETSIPSVILPNAVISIGEGAFRGCEDLKKVIFGNNVKSIGREAFELCFSLEEVDIGDLVNWCGINFESSTYGFIPAGSVNSNPLSYAKKIYLNGHELDELIIPEGVTTIKANAFNNCQRFDKLEIPTSVISIGDYAFSSCGDLDNIVFKSPVNLDSIGAGSFAKCIGLTDVFLPDCITKLENGAFRDCTNLVNIKLPSGLTVLQANMFYNCTNLPSIDLPETLTTIGNWSFYNCGVLTRINIPASVEYIGTEAFKNTSALQGVYIKDMAAWCNIKYGNLQVQDGGGTWGFELKESNPLIRSHNLYLNEVLVTDLVIPEGVETIEACTFWGAECIKSVKLPTSLKKIKHHAFWYTKIRHVMIPNSVDSIEKEAFGFLQMNKDERLSVCLDNVNQWFRDYGSAFNNSGGGYLRGYIDLYIKGEEIPVSDDGNVIMLWIGSIVAKVDNLVVPDSITKLNELALSSLSLNSVTLHSGIESIASSTFKYTLMNIVYSQSKFPPTIFKGSSQTTSLFDPSYNNSPLKAIYVPNGRGNSYKTKWSGHADIIIETNPDMTGEQSAESISQMKSACAAINGATTYIDLTNAILDETVTAETLKAGDEDSNVFYYLPSGTTGITGDNIIIDGVAESVNLTDGKAINVPKEFSANSICYNRSFIAGEFYSLCLPYNYTLPETIRAYSMYIKNSHGDLIFTETDDINANVPYLIEATADVSSLYATTVRMTETPDEMADAGINGFEFRGTLKPISHEDAVTLGAYMLDENKTWIPVEETNPESTIVATRAYLVPTAEYAKSSISCMFYEPDDPILTTIAKISTEEHPTCYNLYGRKIETHVGNMPKGLYINNKKKVVIQ